MVLGFPQDRNPPNGFGFFRVVGRLAIHYLFWLR